TLLAAPLASGAAAPRATGGPVHGKYVDVHVHLTQPWGNRPHLNLAQFLAWMDQRQVAQAVILPLVSPEGWYYPISSDWVLEQTRSHRNRLVPFCDIDPRCNYLNPKSILAQLKTYLEAGAKGLGEHKCGGPIDSPGNLDIFRACSELKLPILFHSDSLRNTDEPGLPGLERCLREAPGATFIGHANTFWASISAVSDRNEFAGYPKTPVKPGGALDRLMDKYPNLYGDLSAGSGLNAIRRDPDFGREFLLRRADRLLFGTDYLADGQEVGQFEFLDQLDLPAEVQAKIFRDNARCVLGLA
ncbi:MAG: amidohydrolase, partial [Pirellulales bacterium]|nr:amidohydrolase [Pirellulales bacterium]